MIHPRMATMLSVILTDAGVAPETLFGGTVYGPTSTETMN